MSGYHKYFQTLECQLERGDMLYTFSDGFQDQFGGISGRKYMKTRFRDFLQQRAKADISEQLTTIEDEHTKCRGNFDQTDDILIIGMRF